MIHGIIKTFKHSQSIQFLQIIKIILFLLLIQQGAFSYKITSVKQSYSLQTEVKSFTENLEPINNPVEWQPISFIAKEGARVKKGDVVVEFDTSALAFRLETKRLDQAIIDKDLQTRLNDIDTKESQMLETLNTLNEQLEILLAQQQLFMSIPREEDIRMAEGRLKVAKMNMDASSSDLEKAELRLRKKMISPTEFEKREFQFNEKKALYDFAIAEFELTNLKTSRRTLNALKLQIESVRLEKAKLLKEISDYKSIAAIQRTNANTKKKINETNIEEIINNIKNSTLVSQLDGYISLESYGGEVVNEGMKFWKGFRLMNIADISTIAFKATIREELRQYFKVGDPVQISIIGKQDKKYSGTLKSIDHLAKDLAEKETTGWEDVGKKYGIKVYEITLQLDETHDWLMPGMRGVAKIQAFHPFEGPAVPIKYIHKKNGNYHLYHKQKSVPVSGYINDGWFLLKEDHWEGKEIDYPKLRKKIRQDPLEKKSKMLQRFKVSGEMKPANSIDIITGSIGWGNKVSWLIDEETQVKKGEKVAVLSNQDLKKNKDEALTNLKTAQGELEEAQKNKIIAQRESIFNNKKAENELQISTIHQKIVHSSISSTALIQAELERTQSQLNYARIKKEVENEQNKKLTSRSPLEIQKLKESLTIAKLKLEKQSILLEQISKGATLIEKNTANLEVLEKKNHHEILIQKQKLDEVRSRTEVKNKERTLYWNNRNLNKILRREKSMTVHAPADGIIQYGSIWVSGGIGKISEGASVGKNTSILSLPDYSSMFMSVEIPEIYYSKIHIDQNVSVEIPSMNNLVLKGHVSEIDILFKNKGKPSNQSGIYSSHEPLGLVVFSVKIHVDQKKEKIKPGAVGNVFFPFQPFPGSIE